MGKAVIAKDIENDLMTKDKGEDQLPQEISP